MKAWSALWLEQAGINTIAADVEENADGTIASLTLTQSAPARHPVLRHTAGRQLLQRTSHHAASVRTDASNSTWTARPLVVTKGRRQAAPGVHPGQRRRPDLHPSCADACPLVGVRGRGACTV
ncbi:MAG: hypothetical protein ACLUUF_00250 [Bifidobacterium pullorum]